MTKNKHLTIQVAEGKLIIEIGIETLAMASYLPLSDYSVDHEDYITPLIVDNARMAIGVCNELLEEDEEGTTMVHEMLDKAIMRAYENGSEGFHEDKLITVTEHQEKYSKSS